MCQDVDIMFIILPNGMELLDIVQYHPSNLDLLKTIKVFRANIASIHCEVKVFWPTSS